MGAVLPAVAEELLREVKRTYEDTSQVSDELLLGLKFIFGPTALQALDLVDQRSVTQVTSPSGRTTFQEIAAVRILQFHPFYRILTIVGDWKFWKAVHLLFLLPLLFLPCIFIFCVKEKREHVV